MTLAELEEGSVVFGKYRGVLTRGVRVRRSLEPANGPAGRFSTARLAPSRGHGNCFSCLPGMKIPKRSRWKTAIVLAVTSIALMGPAYAQDSQGLPMPVPHSDPKKAPDPAPSSSTRISGKVHSVDGHLLTLTDSVQLVFFPGFTEQHGELRTGATIKASYAETAGRKVVTSIRVDPL